LPEGLAAPRLAMPGVIVVEGPPSNVERHSVQGLDRILSTFDLRPSTFDTGADADAFPLIVIVDDSEFAARNLNNFLWVTFTRANPAADIGGVGSFTDRKHWGCTGPLVIDARIKPHHAPPLVEDPEVTRRIDALAARGGPLARWL
jgi:4-hydroxy-3-polyprenylbenzoate decarboxylase